MKEAVRFAYRSVLPTKKIITAFHIFKSELKKNAFKKSIRHWLYFYLSSCRFVRELSISHTRQFSLTGQNERSGSLIGLFFQQKNSVCFLSYEILIHVIALLLSAQ